MWRAGFKWMFLIIGTTIGAGYASGRELWQFFGHESVLAIGLFTILFTMCCFVIMKISFDYKSVHYIPLLERLLGKKLTKLYDWMIIIYLFSTTVVMLAGGGATLQALHVPYWIGVAIISFLIITLFLWESKGMVALNAAIIPILITLLVLILVTFIRSKSDGFLLDLHHHSNWPAAFTFTALNIISLLAVLAGVGNEMKQKGEVWIASIGSGLLLGSISLLYNQSLIKVAHELVVYEIPLFAILKHYPYMMMLVMSVLLWFAIYTTAVSGLFGLISRFRKYLQVPTWLLASIIIICMLPLTAFGFSTLIGILYPLYGVLNLYLLGSILLYPIVKRFE
ncbi:YkvI family membrane protein [Bacillus taeanensis]|uniref:Membrane protein YkvI n=1 Tax=Bacillus taeanensis TaxID=273032 RepID=A0A366XTB7_9BACI|nr:hypothetical protein [Bacillus taeanensis]RBW69137.1 hypothetical protein DS031_13355 [Bacillus taeanensis]